MVFGKTCIPSGFCLGLRALISGGLHSNFVPGMTGYANLCPYTPLPPAVARAWMDQGAVGASVHDSSPRTCPTGVARQICLCRMCPQQLIMSCQARLFASLLCCELDKPSPLLAPGWYRATASAKEIRGPCNSSHHLSEILFHGVKKAMAIQPRSLPKPLLSRPEGSSSLCLSKYVSISRNTVTSTYKHFAKGIYI